MGRIKKYFTDEDKRKAKREADRRYYNSHKNKFVNKRKVDKEYMKKYQQDNKEKIYEHLMMYNKTPIGRAIYLLNRYKQSDKEHNRGECDLTSKWIVDNIFSKPCAHCGESDWHKIGCNRLDNSKPHTMDNVEPCCGECNIRLYHKKG